LAEPLRPARPPRLPRARLRRRATGPRRVVSHADTARVARPARRKGHLRRPRADAGRGRRTARMTLLAALAFALARIHIRAARVMPIGYAPAWSPDGDRIAFGATGDVWVADADGTHRDLLVQDADAPAWSPNGRRLAFTRRGVVYTIRVDGLDERRLATGAH